MEYEPLYNEAGEKNGVDPLLLRALVDQESGGDRFAVSDQGAKGLTQLTDGTAAEVGVTNPFVPAQALDGGAKYLRQNYERFGSDPMLAIAAYHGGPNPEEWGPKTRAYASSVYDRWQAYRQQREQQPAVQAPSGFTLDGGAIPPSGFTLDAPVKPPSGFTLDATQAAEQPEDTTLPHDPSDKSAPPALTEAQSPTAGSGVVSPGDQSTWPADRRSFRTPAPELPPEQGMGIPPGTPVQPGATAALAQSGLGEIAKAARDAYAGTPSILTRQGEALVNSTMLGRELYGPALKIAGGAGAAFNAANAAARQGVAEVAKGLGVGDDTAHDIANLDAAFPLWGAEHGLSLPAAAHTTLADVAQGRPAPGAMPTLEAMAADAARENAKTDGTATPGANATPSPAPEAPKPAAPPEATDKPPEPVAAAGAPNAQVEVPAPSQPASSGYTMVDPDRLTMDPERFQYKASDHRGLTGALLGTDRWEPALANPVTAWQDTDGQLYVVNGHQRADLAQRAKAAGQPDVQVPARVFSADDGYTPEFMRALGAYQNIAEGSGTALDAARVLRGAGDLPESMRLPDLPPRSALVRNAAALAQLDDRAFGMVENGIVAPEHAAAVGELIRDPTEQVAAMDALARAQPSTAQQARLMVQDIRNSGFLRGAQTTLFGDEAFAQSLLPERSRVLDNALRTLRRNTGVFRAAVEGEETLTGAGNVLSREANVAARTENERLLDTLQRDATTRGPISDALSAAATDLAAGKPASAVTSRFLSDSRRIVRDGEGARGAAGDVAGGAGLAEPGGEAGGVEPPVAPGTGETPSGRTEPASRDLAEQRRGPGGDASLRKALDAARRGDIRRGAAAISDRLRLQAGLDEAKAKKAGASFAPLSRDDARAVEDFIDFLGRHMVQDVGLRILRGGDHGALGAFSALDRTVYIFRKAIQAGELPRTAVHELWHAMESALPREDAVAVTREFQQRQTQWLKSNEWARAFLRNGEIQDIMRGHQAAEWLSRHADDPQAMRQVSVDRSGRSPAVSVAWDAGNYRFKNRSEYFAETMADHYFNDLDIRDAKARSVVAHARDIWRRMVSAVRRLWGGDATGRIYEGFGRQEYERRTGPLLTGDDVAEARRLPSPPRSGTDLFGDEEPEQRERAPEPTIRTDPRQATLPGTEPSARQAQAARDAAAPRSGQLPVNDGLFARRDPEQGELRPPRIGNDVAAFERFAAPLTQHEAAAHYPVVRGHQTGHEHLTAYDPATDHVVAVHTSQNQNFVAFPPELETRLRNPSNALVLHHNHPAGTSLSVPDLMALAYPGLEWAVAHGANGTFHAAKLTERFRRRMEARGDWDTNRVAAEIRSEAEDASRRVIRSLQRDVHAGRIDVEDANLIHSDVVNRALHEKGLIDYTTSGTIPEHTASIAQLALRSTTVGMSDARLHRPAFAVRPEEGIARVLADSRDAAARRSPGAGGNGADAARAGDGGPARLLEDADQVKAKLYSFPTSLFDPEAWRRVAPAIRPIVRAAGMAVAAARDVGDSIATGLAPMRSGSTRAQAFAATFANSLRQVMYRYGEIDREIERRFAPKERADMGRAMDAQSVFEQTVRDLPEAEQAARRAEFDRAGDGLAKLPEHQRHVLEMLDQLSQATWRRMQERGMVAPDARGLPYYFPRQVLLWSEAEGFSRPPGRGGSGRGIDARGANLTTAGPMSREHLTAEETEAAARAKLGGNALVLPDIRSLPSRLAFAERAIAGVDLMNQIEHVGREAGVDLVAHGDIPGLLHPGDFFTMADHPAFRRWTGSGWQATHVAKEFEGPLRAVLTQKSPTWYRAAQQLKGGVMSAIMFSPFIHLAVELGRALPVMPGRILTLRALRDGSTLRRDLGYMDQATRDGLAPLGRGWHADPISIADATTDGGRNRFVRALQGMRDAVANGAGRVGGDFLHDVVQHPHQTLLWDQVFNLQVGIYDEMRRRWVASGFDPQAAGTMAAHVANRYAGALPPEHLSRAANMTANLLLFSRSFTLGNLGVMKDMLTGAPQHILSRIEQMAGPEAAKSAQSALRRKAIAAFTMDIGLFYLANGLLQAGLQTLRNAPAQGLLPAAQQTYQQWLDEAGTALHNAHDNPLEIFGALPQHWNEPGKQDRVYAGADSQGRGIYLRLPPGKVGEEFLGWFAKPGVMLTNKASPLVRPILEDIMGHDSLGRQLFKPDPQTIGDYLGVAGAAAWHILEGLGPTSAIQGTKEIWQQHVQGRPTQADPYVSALKVAGPLTGLAQISQGYPGGPVAGEMHAQSERERFALQQALPAIRAKIMAGDQSGATADMEALHVPYLLQRYYIGQTLHPGPTRSAVGRSGRGASEVERDRVQRHLGAP